MNSYIFVGLGNPGSRYEKTRHNIGFMVIEEFARELGWPLKEEKRFKAKVARGEIDGCQIHLILPLTYMNESGTAVRKYLDFYRLDRSGVVVVTDDVAIDFGELRLKPRGSAGGHNGLKSIQQHLGTVEYARLRMGVGAPIYTSEDALADYVLSAFSVHENKELPSLIEKGASALKRLLNEDVSRVMNDVNTKQKKRSPEEGREK